MLSRHLLLPALALSAAFFAAPACAQSVPPAVAAAVSDKARPEAWRDRMEWIDYGFAVISRQAILDGVAPGASADLSDLVRDLSLSGRLAGFEVTERFYEIGSPEGLLALDARLGSV